MTIYYVHFVDYEPLAMVGDGMRWDDLTDRDVWLMFLNRGGPQRARERMQERLQVLDEFGVPVSWCVDTWWPHNQWLYFNAEMLAERQAIGDTISPHFHWVEWVKEADDPNESPDYAPGLGKWHPRQQPTRQLFDDTYRDGIQAFDRMGLTSGTIIRSGWCSQEFADGSPIWPEYDRIGWRGCADFRHGGVKWHGDFLLLGYNNRDLDGPIIVHYEHVPSDAKEDNRLRRRLASWRTRFGDDFKPITADGLYDALQHNRQPQRSA